MNHLVADGQYEEEWEAGQENLSEAEVAGVLFAGHVDETMRRFWSDVTNATQAAQADYDFTRHDLPAARIRRIMRQDACDNPRMIGNDAVQLTAYACELFARSLTTRAWCFTERENRHTLQRRDLLGAVMSSEKYDFLVDITSEAQRQAMGDAD